MDNRNKLQLKQISQLLITSFNRESVALSGNHLTTSDTGSCSCKFSTILDSFPFRFRLLHQQPTCVFPTCIHFCDMVLHLQCSFTISYLTSNKICKPVWFNVNVNIPSNSIVIVLLVFFFFWKASTFGS